MSFHFPRRVKDLPKLELESEDEVNTPCKAKNNTNAILEEKKRFSKEYPANTRNESDIINSVKSLRMLPKRRAELPALESDSDEEDIAKEVNLNCAILNDSFLVSPNKSDREETCSNNSLLDHFKRMGLKNSPDETLHPLRQLQVSTDNAEIEDGTNLLASNNKQSTTVDGQFVTPQIRSFSVRRRPRVLCSTQSKKTKSAIVNEFRSQKVLFQTPMAISRAPIMQNDSISLTLCDTINEGGTPSTSEKTPQCVNERHPKDTARSKKSLEVAFSGVSKENEDKEIENNEAATNSTTKDKTTTVHINSGTFVIIKKLGCGGSSSVYLAKKQDSDKEYALKVVDLQGDPSVVEGYLNETKLLAKLQGNVCVVSLYEYQLLQKESKLFLVMEKGDSDLHKILQSYTTNLPLYVLTNFLYQMLQAVNYIHQNGVIHSDLKPANFLMVNGRLKLIDFGIASNIAIDSTSIIKFSQAGTFNYISPEALTDTSTGSSPMRNNQPKIKISTKSDVWSLGCILYLLLYQKTPFGHIKNLYTKITAICCPTQTIEYGPLPPYYPAMLVHMTKNCLQHNPKRRPSCAELLKYPFNMIIPIQNLTLPTI
ncbi:hypothetical protein DOY81_001835 [Sarcophaga bullata]|nr:hypothetical protein DOY81_001835 [Sarcophaga bullata]